MSGERERPGIEPICYLWVRQVASILGSIALLPDTIPVSRLLSPSTCLYAQRMFSCDPIGDVHFPLW